jgi:hypothetical protein
MENTNENADIFLRSNSNGKLKWKTQMNKTLKKLTFFSGATQMENSNGKLKWKTQMENTNEQNT